MGPAGLRFGRLRGFLDRRQGRAEGWIEALAATGLILLVLLRFGTSLNLSFVGADTLALIATARVRSGSELLDLLRQPLMEGTPFAFQTRFYRPISVLSFTLDGWLWGLNPFGYHLTNLLLQIAVTLLLVWTIRLVTGRRSVAWGAGALFTLHATLVESVPVASRRQDLLVTLWLLIALGALAAAFRTSSPRARRVGQGVSWAAFLLALGTKETAFAFPLTAGIFLCLQGLRGRQVLTALSPYLLLALGWGLWRGWVLGAWVGGYAQPSVQPGGLTSQALEGVALLLDPGGVLTFFLVRSWGPPAALVLGTLGGAGLLWVSRRSPLSGRRRLWLRTCEGLWLFFLFGWVLYVEAVYPWIRERGLELVAARGASPSDLPVPMELMMLDGARASLRLFFVGLFLTAAAWTVLRSRMPVRATLSDPRFRPLLFLFGWFLSAFLPLLALSSVSLRYLYGPAAPWSGILAWGVADLLPRVRSSSAARAGLGLLLLLVGVQIGPGLGMQGWKAVSAYHEDLFAGLARIGRESAREEPFGTSLHLVDLPFCVFPPDRPHVDYTPLPPYALQSWLDLAVPNAGLQAFLEGRARGVLCEDERPPRAEVRVVRREPGRLWIRVRLLPSR